MKSNSLFKSLRIGSRKNKHSTTSEGSELESSTKGKIANPNSVSATPAVALDVETLGNDVSQNQLAVLESSIPRSITPTLKDQHILHPLHKSTTSNLMPLEGQFPVDIIAVHGLNGGAHKTWTHANNHFWLQDDLPDAFPGARVYSYGYPAEVLLTREKSDMADFARDLLRAVNDERTTPEAKRRPLIFMCHSMGGIVVKKAFNISVVDQEDYGAIRKAVPAIMFFATPHGGSGYANFFSKLARVSNGPLVGAGGLKIRHDLIKSLKKDSSTLADISMDFRRHTKDLKIFSFLEKATTPPLSEKVVDDTSALLYAANETPIPMLGCDHRTICRFSGKEDPNYNKVFKILQRVVTEATTSQ